MNKGRTALHRLMAMALASASGFAYPAAKAKREAREANTAIQQEIIAAAAAKRARRALRPVVDMTVRK